MFSPKRGPNGDVYPLDYEKSKQFVKIFGNEFE
jgi:hypothetical protein